MEETNGNAMGGSALTEGAEGNEVLQQMIREYRESLKKEIPELDIELLFRILRLMNDSSEVHVSIDPIDVDGEWDSTAPTYGVGGLIQLDDGRYALRVRGEKHGITVGDLEQKLRKTFKRNKGSGVPVLAVMGESTIHLTDAYSHALVRDKWAGLPFDLVLAVRNEKKKEENKDKDE